MKRLILSFFALPLLALLAGASAAQADTRILLNCFPPSKHVWCEALRSWAEQVESVTEGRVQVTVPPKSLAPPPEQLNSVRNGLFDAAFVFNGFIAKEVAGPMVSMNPFTGSDSAESNSVALWRTYSKFFAGKDEFEGVELLGLVVNPGAHFYSMTDKPVNSMAEATDRKMWALPGATAGILKSKGGAVVSGPAAQMTEIIQRGVVDGFVGVPPQSAVAFNVLPYAKSVTRTPASVFTATFSFFINEDKWAEIGPRDQELIRSVSDEAFARMVGQKFDAKNAASIKKEEGMVKVYQASDSFYAELQAAAKPFAGKWVGRIDTMGIDGAAMLDFYINEVKQLQAN